jgi:lipopolysaccharide export system protein LptA
MSVESKDPSKKRLLAYNHVKIFKKDMQGKADSLAYQAKDSTLVFYRDPVLWTSGNQMTADSIQILLKDKKINRVYLIANSFVVSQDTLLNFNQIKGRKMTAYFAEKNLHQVVVEGNGESLYFALQAKEEVKEDKTSEKYTIMSGMNKIVCSNMRINFQKGKVNNISFYRKPDASFIPPKELKPEELQLKGFIWRGKERPTQKEVTHKE